MLTSAHNGRPSKKQAAHSTALMGAVEDLRVGRVSWMAPTKLCI